MDRQLSLILKSPEDRQRDVVAYFKPKGLTRREERVVELLAGRGEITRRNGQSCSELSISRREAARLCGCSAWTFAAGVADLQGRRVLDVVVPTKPTARRRYVIFWELLNRYPNAPSAELAGGLDKLGEAWKPGPPPAAGRRWPALVGAGRDPQEPRTRNSKPQDPNQTKPVLGPTDQRQPAPTSANQRQPAPTSADQRHGQPAAPLRLQLDDAAIWAAISGGSVQPLAEAFAACVAQGYLARDDEDKRKFLALVHHAYTAPGINSPPAVIVAAISAYNFSRVRQESFDWAAEFRRRRQANQAGRCGQPRRRAGHLAERDRSSAAQSVSSAPFRSIR